jgi:hypothetical protein
MDKVAWECIEKCEKHAKDMLETMNKMYMDVCNEWLMVPSEESYRNYINNFIQELFDLNHYLWVENFHLLLHQKEIE